MGIDAPGKDRYAELLALWKTAFGDYNGFWERFLETVFDPACCRCLFREGRVAAALYWFPCQFRNQRIAYIYAVATDPDFRGQGLCRTLLADTHRYLASLGFHSAMLVPEGEPLRHMYRRMGYRDCTRVTEFSCSAADTVIALRPVSPQEYGALRRTLLPPGGVLQEEINLSFLGAQAELLAGETCLLAVYLEEGVLHATEYLGSRELAPSIVRSLGCETGYFRMPGSQRPFAMIFPLAEDAAVPDYFGLAFD